MLLYQRTKIRYFRSEMTFVFTYASQLIVPFFPLERQCGRDGAHTCRPNAWLLVFGLIFLSAPALSQDRETHVRKNKSNTNQELISEEDVQTARPERQISRLRRNGFPIRGPSEPANPHQRFYRIRVGVYWDGFSLEDPGGGISDLGQIPRSRPRGLGSTPAKVMKLGGL